MKRLIKAIEKFFTLWVLSPNLLELVYRCVWSFLSYRKSNKFIGVSIELGKHKNHETVLIIANGPSLNNLKIENLSDVDVFGVNNLHNHNHFAEMNLTALFTAEPFPNNTPIEKRADDIACMINLCKATRKEHHCPIVIDRGFTCLPEIAKLSDLVTYKRSCVKLEFMPIRKASCHSDIIPRVRNTTQLAIYTAINLNYRNILLAGLDEGQLAEPAFQRNVHFYAEDEETLATETSFEPYSARCLNKHYTLKGYEKLEQLARARGVKVFNLNERSFVDCFAFNSAISREYYKGE